MVHNGKQVVKETYFYEFVAAAFANNDPSLNGFDGIVIKGVTGSREPFFLDIVGARANGVEGEDIFGLGSLISRRGLLY